jgi:AcrR family transcriptional regulator
MSTPDTTLLVAEELLSQGGPAALSTRAVAGRLGVSRQVVYTQFGDKSGLLRALHDEGFRRLTADVVALTEAAGTDDGVVAVAAAYRASALRSPELYALMFDRPPPDFRKDAGSVAVARASYAHIVTATSRWAETQRAAPSGGATALARSLWSTTHGHVALELAGHGGRDAGIALERSVRLLLAGARGRGAPPPH